MCAFEMQTFTCMIRLDAEHAGACVRCRIFTNYSLVLHLRAIGYIRTRIMLDVNVRKIV